MSITMKLHFFIFSIFLFSSCNFFSQKDPVKEKAVTLFEKITTDKNDLETRIDALTKHEKTTVATEVVDTDMDLNTLGQTINGVFQFWTTAYDKFEKQSVYMNYDLQVIRLEALEKSLNKIKVKVEEAEKMKVE